MMTDTSHQIFILKLQKKKKKTIPLTTKKLETDGRTDKQTKPFDKVDENFFFKT